MSIDSLDNEISAGRHRCKPWSLVGAHVDGAHAVGQEM